MSLWKRLGEGFNGVAELPNACRHIEQRVKEHKYGQLQGIGDALSWPSKTLNATPVLNPVSSRVRNDTGYCGRWKWTRNQPQNHVPLLR